MTKSIEDNNKLFLNVEREYNRLKKIQYEYEWQGNVVKAEWYRQRSKYFKHLLSQGIFYDPRF